jgi:hypothetical protein
VTFRLTERQQEANRVLASPATHIMLFGGSRSGKTFLAVRAIVVRALKAAGSRHAVLRFRFNAVKASIVYDTFPKVMELCFPDMRAELNKSDWFAKFPNGSEVWFGGLDDKERTEKILGQEYVTLFLNECSQIPWASRNIAVTRLAQKAVSVIEGRPPVPLPLKMYYDENPPDKGHWTYRYFVQRVDPETRQTLSRPDDVAAFRINPEDNEANLPAGYMDTLRGLSSRMQRRFLYGEFREANPSALFPQEHLDKWRVIDKELPDMVRIVVAVDPSGADADNPDADAIGIIVAGLGTDGNAYVLEDLTVKASPAVWGKVATSAFERHEADTIVGEVNYGGAMVKAVIQAARPRTPFKEVRASRGKAVRAEPIAGLCEEGKVRLVGYYNPLEDELSGFTTSGYVGEQSPNRADAFVWAISELFPRLILPKVEKKPQAAPAQWNWG